MMTDDYVKRSDVHKAFQPKYAPAINKTFAAMIDNIPAANAVEQPRWIPVTERLPEDGERVLVFGGVTMYVAYYGRNRYGGESWHKLNSKSHYCSPTHWMPLPEPPKEEV